MRAFLKGCSESIDFETKTVQHFLLFQREDGREFKLPSTAEATQQLVQFLSADAAPAPVPPFEPAGEQLPADELEFRDVGPSPDVTAGATEFGGEDNIGLDSPDVPEETEAKPSFEVHDTEPSVEDEVPAL